MQMTNSEIAASYRLAADQKKQISILADLNACTRAEIVDALKKEGVMMPRGGNSKKTKKVETPEAAMQQPETPEEPKLTAPPRKQLALEDALDIMIGALEDFRDAPEGVNRGEAAAAAIAYMSGAADMFKALHGPIVR